MSAVIVVEPHSHKLSNAARAFFLGYALLLFVTGVALTIVYHDGQDRVARLQYDACIQRHDNAVKSVAAYDDLLSRLRSDSDPAIRDFLRAVVTSAQRTEAIKCHKE